MLFRLIVILILSLNLYSCSKKDELIYKPSEKISPYDLYTQGMEGFKRNDFFFASKKFDEAEISFDIVEFAAKSALMSSFSLYSINFYSEAEENIKRYLRTYPGDSNVIYAKYLLAITYYEQIDDEKKDLKPLIKAQKEIETFLKKYPNSDYAIDLKFKNDLIQNQLAAKELYIAKFYISVQKWIPAINRLKLISEKYDKTIFIEEALHRLVEIHYHIGLEQEAKKYANILGYNYNSSEWFKQTYKILNKDYKFVDKSNKKKNNNDNIIKKIIKIIK